MRARLPQGEACKGIGVVGREAWEVGDGMTVLAVVRGVDDEMARGLEPAGRVRMAGVVAGIGMAGFEDMGDSGKAPCLALVEVEKKDPGTSLSCWVAVGEGGFQGRTGVAHPIEAVRPPYLMLVKVKLLDQAKMIEREGRCWEGNGLVTDRDLYSR